MALSSNLSRILSDSSARNAFKWLHGARLLEFSICQPAPVHQGACKSLAHLGNQSSRRLCLSSVCRDDNQNYQWVAHSEGAHDEGAPLPPNISNFIGKTEDTKDLARGWVRQFTERGGIPKREFEIGYSKSSGPGGQHVNKTSTKATIRLPMNCRWIPQWTKDELRKHPTFYVARNDSLQVSSDIHRSQSQNLAECLKKINSQIESVAFNTIPQPPDLEKIKRIAKHEAKFGRAQKEAKQRFKAIKQGRGKVRPE